MRLSCIISLFLLPACLASLGQANEIIVPVTINTSSIAGTAGSIDLQFNPGPLITQSASMMIVNFASSGSLAPGPSSTGDVSGALPAALLFDNGTTYNDYFQGFTFGSSLTFTLKFAGPAVNSPNGTATSGSLFAFSMFSDTAGTVPTLTADSVNGFAFSVGLGLNGLPTVTNSSAQTAIGPIAVPEPDSFLLGIIAALIGGLLALGQRFKRRAVEENLKSSAQLEPSAE
jgi:hypothetical protein